MLRTPASVLVVSCFFVACSSAHGQVRRDKAELAQDHREMRQDEVNRADDWRNTALVEGVLADFDRARAAGNMNGLANVDARLRNLMRAELAEGHGKLAQEHAEVRRDNAEARADRRDERRDVAQGRPGATAADRRDLRDDQRDRRDDVRDARAETRAQDERLRLAGGFAALDGRYAPGDLDRKRALIVDLLQLSRREVRQDNHEMREDRRELNEDRRDLNEDRHR